MIIKMPKINTLLNLGLFVFTIKTGLDLSGIIPLNEYVDSILIVVGLTAFIAAILQQGYTAKVLLKYAVITALSLCSTLLSGQSVIIVSVITILAVRKTDITQVIKNIRLWSSSFLVLHSLYFIALLLLGKAELFSVDGMNRIRASFGFVHANTFSVYLFNIILAWVWENYDRLKTRHLITIAFIGIIAFLFTDSKTSFICTLCLLGLLYIVKKIRPTILQTVAGLIVPFFAGFFLLSYSLWLKGNPIVFVIDNVLTGRIKLGAYALSRYGLTALGQQMDFGSLTWTSQWKLNHFTLDCTYTSLLTNIGWMWLLILSICFYMLAKRKNFKINTFIIMWALYAISEVHGLDVYLCFPSLLVTLLFSSKYDLNVTMKREYT